MAATIDSNALQIVFAQPRPDGSFEDQQVRYLRSLGQRQPILLLAFAPKTAGTFLRQAAMHAAGAGLFRFSHAQGGRDGTPYLPTILACCLDESMRGIVSHIHMQAFASNRHLIEAFGIRPVIMLRSVPDMLASYLDMLETDAVARTEGLNCLIPEEFTEFDRNAKCQFVVDIIAPWYASYYATWKHFVDTDSAAVCVLHYDAFRSDPALALHTALRHAGFDVSAAHCKSAVARVWEDRNNNRFNRGTSGRGKSCFSQTQLEKVSSLLSHYRHLQPWLPELTGEAAAIEGR